MASPQPPMNRRPTNEALRDSLRDLGVDNLSIDEARSRLQGMRNEDINARLAARNVTRRDLDNHLQKGFFKEYVFSVQSAKDWGGIPVVSHLAALVASGVGTVWKIGSLKFVEGIVNKIPVINKIPYIGKIARAAAVAALSFYLWGLWNDVKGLRGDAAVDTILDVENATRIANPADPLTYGGGSAASGATGVAPQVPMPSNNVFPINPGTAR